MKNEAPWVQLLHPAGFLLETLDLYDVLLVVPEAREARVSFLVVVGQERNGTRQLRQLLQQLGEESDSIFHIDMGHSILSPSKYLCSIIGVADPHYSAADPVTDPAF